MGKKKKVLSLSKSVILTHFIFSLFLKKAVQSHIPAVGLHNFPLLLRSNCQMQNFPLVFLLSISGKLKVQDFLTSLFNFASQKNRTENLLLSLGTLVQSNRLMTSSPSECISFFLLFPLLPHCCSPSRATLLCSKLRAVQKICSSSLLLLGPGLLSRLLILPPSFRLRSPEHLSSRIFPHARCLFGDYSSIFLKFKSQISKRN